MQVCLTTYLVSFLTTSLGVPLVRAGLTLTVALGAGVAGRIVWGGIADRLILPRRMLGTLGLVMALSAAATCLLSLSWPYAAIVVLGALFGASAVGWNGVYLAEVARKAPPGMAGMATGGTLFFTFFGGVVAPPVFGGIAGAGHRYALAYFLIAVPVFLFSLMLFRGPAAGSRGARPAGRTRRRRRRAARTTPPACPLRGRRGLLSVPAHQHGEHPQRARGQQVPPAVLADQGILRPGVGDPQQLPVRVRRRLGDVFHELDPVDLFHPSGDPQRVEHPPGVLLRTVGEHDAPPGKPREHLQQLGPPGHDLGDGDVVDVPEVIGGAHPVMAHQAAQRRAVPGEEIHPYAARGVPVGPELPDDVLLDPVVHHVPDGQRFRIERVVEVEDEERRRHPVSIRTPDVETEGD